MPHERQGEQPAVVDRKYSARFRLEIWRREEKKQLISLFPYTGEKNANFWKVRLTMSFTEI